MTAAPAPAVAAAPPTTTRRASTAHRPSTLRLGASRTALELREFFRERDAVVFVFAYPIIMMAIFATVFSGDIDLGPGGTVAFAQYFLPGMVATGVLLSSFQNVATGIAVERDEGRLKRLRGTPMPPSAYFLGKVGSVLVTSLVQVALLLAVATLAFGVELPSTTDRWLTFAWVFALGTASGTVCGVAFSSVPRSGRSASAVVTPVVLVLQFVSGVFFQYDQLPSWMQDLAALFPLKWMAQGMRSVFLPDEALVMEPAGDWQHAATAGVLVAYLVVGLVVGARTFRWRRRDDG